MRIEDINNMWAKIAIWCEDTSKMLRFDYISKYYWYQKNLDGTILRDNSAELGAQYEFASTFLKGKNCKRDFEILIQRLNTAGFIRTSDNYTIDDIGIALKKAFLRGGKNGSILLKFDNEADFDDFIIDIIIAAKAHLEQSKK